MAGEAQEGCCHAGGPSSYKPQCSDRLDLASPWGLNSHTRARIHTLCPATFASYSVQFGIMLALGTDPVTWYRIKQLVPDIVPRGEAGWKHF